MVSVSLPLDVIPQVLEGVNIGDRCRESARVLMGHSTPADAYQKDLDSFVRRRENPLIYLKQFVKNPKKLLKVMRFCMTVLSGSRALDYFVPGSCREDSDWDFFCSGDIVSVAMFTYWLSFHPGVEWEGSNRTTIDPDKEAAKTERSSCENKNLNLLQGQLEKKGKIVKVRVIWSASITALGNVMSFHSSAIQCFISGFCAVSMYHEYTSNNESIYWTSNDSQATRQRTLATKRVFSIYNKGEDGTTGGRIESDAVPLLMSKYISRGFKYVSFRSRDEICDPKSKRTFARGGRHRVVGDSGCYIVKFNKYIDTTAQEPSFDDYMEGVGQISWYEGSLGTRLTRVPEDILDPCTRVSFGFPKSNAYELCSNILSIEDMEIFPPWMYHRNQLSQTLYLRFSFGAADLRVPC